MKVGVRFLTLFLLGILLSGCPASGGIDPPHDRFIYPIGAAVINDGKRLMVVNSNFDLRYNAGTITVVDLDKVAATQGNIDDESTVIEKDNVLELGAYASDLRLTPDGKHALIPVRGESAVSVIDINDDGRIHCNEGADFKCDDDHRIKSNDNFDLPIEPYAVTAADYHYVPDDSTRKVTMGFITHLAGGEVSLACLDPRMPPELVGVIKDLPESASGVAIQPRTGLAFVTNRTEPRLSILRIMYEDSTYPCNSPYFYELGSLNLTGLASGIDSRGIAFSPDGNTAFVVNRAPDALVLIDTSIDENGAPRNKVMSVMEMDSEPSLVVPHSEKDATGRDHLFVYVVCFAVNRIYIIDPEIRETVAIILTREGPHQLVFDPVRPRAYVIHFVENTIGVIDTEKRQIIQLIGATEMPKSHG